MNFLGSYVYVIQGKIVLFQLNVLFYLWLCRLAIGILIGYQLGTFD